jgi:hypothetical protein
MSTTIDIVQLEAEIMRLLREQPPVEGELSPTLNAVVEVYARMIYNRQRRIDIAALPEDCRRDVQPEPGDSEK